jgi:hypothetical protein
MWSYNCLSYLRAVTWYCIFNFDISVKISILDLDHVSLATTELGLLLRIWIHLDLRTYLRCCVMMGNGKLHKIWNLDLMLLDTHSFLVAIFFKFGDPIFTNQFQWENFTCFLGGLWLETSSTRNQKDHQNIGD